MCYESDAQIGPGIDQVSLAVVVNSSVRTLQPRGATYSATRRLARLGVCVTAVGRARQKERKRLLPLADPRGWYTNVVIALLYLGVMYGLIFAWKWLPHDCLAGDATRTPIPSPTADYNSAMSNWPTGGASTWRDFLGFPVDVT